MAYSVSGDSGVSQTWDKPQVYQARYRCRGKRVDSKRSSSPQPGHIQTVDSPSCSVSVGRGRSRGRSRGSIENRAVIAVDPPGRRGVPFDDGAPKSLRCVDLPEQGAFDDAPEFDVQAEDFSDELSCDSKLEVNINKLGRVRKNDPRLELFYQDNIDTAMAMFSVTHRNPQLPGAKKNCLVLMKFAEVFRFGGISKTALVWYEKINRHLYGCMSEKQKAVFEKNFKSLLESVLENSFDHTFTKINNQFIPENYMLLLNVFQDRKAYDLLHSDQKGKAIAIASRAVSCRNKNTAAEKILEYTSHDELKEHSRDYISTSHPVWWVARFMWISAVGALRKKGRFQLRQMMKEAEDAAWSIPEEVWYAGCYAHIPQSYYHMKQTYFECCLEGHDNPKDEEDLRQYISEIRKEYPKICKSVERQKVMISNGLEYLCQIMLRSERLEEVDPLLDELEKIEYARLGNKEPLGVTLIKAEKARTEYKNAKKKEKDTGKLMAARESVERYVKVMVAAMEGKYCNSAVAATLGKLYFELEKWKEADEVFSKYKGYSGLCKRLHAVCLGYLGEYQRASDMYEQLEKKGKEEFALFSIYHEHSITFSKWIQSGIPAPAGIVLKALNKCRNAIEEAKDRGKENWDAPWNAVGHICDVLHQKGDNTFATVRLRLIDPINQCTNWSEAAAVAFTIANGEKPNEVRQQISKVGPAEYRRLLKTV